MTYKSLHYNTADLDEETKHQVFIQKMKMHHDAVINYAKTLQPDQMDLLISFGEQHHFNEDEVRGIIEDAGLYFD